MCGISRVVCIHVCNNLKGKHLFICKQLKALWRGGYCFKIRCAPLQIDDIDLAVMLVHGCSISTLIVMCIIIWTIIIHTMLVEVSLRTLPRPPLCAQSQCPSLVAPLGACNPRIDGTATRLQSSA